MKEANFLGSMMVDIVTNIAVGRQYPRRDGIGRVEGGDNQEAKGG